MCIMRDNSSGYLTAPAGAVVMLGSKEGGKKHGMKPRAKIAPSSQYRLGNAMMLTGRSGGGGAVTEKTVTNCSGTPNEQVGHRSV